MSKVGKNKKSLFHKLNDRLKSMSVLEKWCESEKITLNELCLGKKLETKSIYAPTINIGVKH